MSLFFLGLVVCHDSRICYAQNHAATARTHASEKTNKVTNGQPTKTHYFRLLWDIMA
jgi:hypothetical protein